MSKDPYWKDDMDDKIPEPFLESEMPEPLTKKKPDLYMRGWIHGFLVMFIVAVVVTVLSR